jgi:hypothetical protein
VRRTQGLGVFVGARTVEAIDNATHVVAQTWKATGLAGALCAPRSMVLLRTWRRDDDGTFVVLYQSTRHRAVRLEEQGRGWSKPVRVTVQAAGFTVAPLLPQYQPSSGVESQECLVTLVLKADLGGWLADSSTVGRLLGPLGTHAARALLERIVTSVVVLRDQVEQDRFVIRPLGGGNNGEVDQASGEESQSGASGVRRRPALGRSGTILGGGGRDSLAVLQRQATARLRPAATSIVLGGVRSAAGMPATITAAAAAAAAVDPSGGKPRIAEVVEGIELEPMAVKPAAAAVAKEVLVPGPALDVFTRDDWAVPGTCPQRYWSCPGSGTFKVSGFNLQQSTLSALSRPSLQYLISA